MKTVVDLLLGFLAVNGVLAIAAASAVFASWHVAIAVSVLLALGLVAVSIVTRRFSLSWAALIAFAGGLIVSLELDDYAALRRSEVVRVASPAQATGEGRSFVFLRSVVRSDLQAEFKYETSRRGSQSGTIAWFYAAPLTDESWNSGEPVPAWAICRYKPCLADWAKGCGAAVPLPALHVDEYRQVVAVAEVEHGLQSVPGAPMLACVESPEAALAAQFEATRFALVFWNVTWLCGWLGFGIYRLVRPRPAPPPAPGRTVS
ncbi:MAG: hypothetical protein NDJ94_24235 [Vicinamibacteria bacterium]|jgi:hypothetical protein|nr:hypothetical protein [Vicinamibacteria bacterium]